MHFLRTALRNGRRWSSTSARPLRTASPNLVRNLSLATALSLTTYSLGSVYPHPLFTFISPRPAQPPPSDPTSPASQAYASSLEYEIQSLPLLVSLRTAPDAGEWYEARPYVNYPEERRANNLTAGALRGPGKLTLPALVRAKKDESESIVLVHVGRGLCGHDGIVHGGLLATLLDEILARTAILNLPDQIGVTASLSIDYRAPARADQFLVFRTKLANRQGRKAVVSGRIETLDGELVAESSGIFVQPKYAAKLLNTSAIKQAMGVAEPYAAKPEPVHLADGKGLPK